MSCFLFCTAFVDKNMPDHRPIRYKKWIDYYSRIKNELGADYIFMLDDASPDLQTDPELVNKISVTEDLPDELSEKINIVSFKDHLGRPTWREYSGWWRSFTYSIQIARKYGFEKIIHIESDFYVISDRLVRFIASLNSGWTALFCTYGKIPETGIQIICDDCFSQLESIYKQAQLSAYRYTFDVIAERLLPITDVVRDFKGDRFNWPMLQGWLSGDLEVDGLDYYGQLPTEIKPFSIDELKKALQDMKPHLALNAEPDESAFNRIMMNVLHSNNLLLEV
jgi:hypothetical protein